MYSTCSVHAYIFTVHVYKNVYNVQYMSGIYPLTKTFSRQLLSAKICKAMSKVVDGKPQSEIQYLFAQQR